VSIMPEGGWSAPKQRQDQHAPPNATYHRYDHDRPPKSNSHHALWVGVVLCVASLLAVYFGRGFVDGFIAGFEWQQEGHPGLPSCDSRVGQADAKRALEGSPLAKTLNITIVTFTNPQTFSTSKDKVECEASVMLNSSATGSIDYSFSKNSSLPSGQYLVRAVLKENDLNSAP
jgi:hypothetical protein